MNAPWTHRNAGLSDLIGEHRAIASLLPRDGRVIYLDYAFTRNIGDQLIVLGTLEFFKRHAIQVKMSRNIHNLEKTSRLDVKDGDVLVFHGGGNFGDIYPHFQHLRESVIARFPHNRVVIMPQTVHFDDPEMLARSCERLAQHPDLTLFVRDRVSLGLVAPFLGERVRLAPDMAHQLWPTILTQISGRGAVEPAEKPLFLIRRDVEKADVPPELLGYRSAFTDWHELTSMRFRIARKLVRNQYGLARRGVRFYDLDCAYFSAMKAEILRTAAALDRFTPWITSRMHGAILGLLLGKPVFALDNRYGKLSSYFDAWKQWINPIMLIRTPAETKLAMEFLADTQGQSREVRWAAYQELAGW